MGIEGDEETVGLILMKDFDPLRIVFVIEEMDVFFDQFDGGFIDSAVKGNGAVAIDFTSGSGTEEVGEVSGSGPHEVDVLGKPIQGGFLGGGMDVSVVGLIRPLFKSFVEGGQGEGRREEREKLHPKGFEPSLNFALSLGSVRGAVDEGDAEGSRGMSEEMGAKGRAVVEINLSGEPPFAQSLHEAVDQVFEVFLEIELPMEDETGVVVQEGKEKTLAHFPVNDHRRSMHTVRLPEIIGELGFIPSEVRFDPLWFVESASLKEPIETLDRGVKVGRQKLSLPGHPENHGQGGSLEFCLESHQRLLRFFIQRAGFPFVRTLLRLETFDPATTVSVLLEPLQDCGPS
jgi:hypothetical protein